MSKRQRQCYWTAALVLLGAFYGGMTMVQQKTARSPSSGPLIGSSQEQWGQGASALAGAPAEAATEAATEAAAEPKLFAFPEPVTYVSANQQLRDELVDVRLIIPGIRVEMMYAGPNNFTGRTLYPLDLCLLQKGTAAKLKAAQGVFLSDGYQLVIRDAYRPFSVQVAMYEYLGDSQYLANPHRSPSIHNRGAAVDVTLMDLAGNYLEMPSAVDTFDSTAHRTYTPAVGQPQRSRTAQDNMDYLTQVMTEAGFTTIKSEWWHFEDGDKAGYPATDHDFLVIEQRTLTPEEEAAYFAVPPPNRP